MILALGVLPLVASISSLMQYREMLLAIYLVVGLAAFTAGLRRTDEFSDFLFMTTIMSMSLCLILSSAFVSQNLRGDDVHIEYFYFSQTFTTGRWSFLASDTFDAVLSVTVLPTVVSHISGVNGLTIFEDIFSLLYSIVPLALYRVYRKILVPSAAFLSTFLFMAYPTFFEEIRAVTRQEVAELIMVVLFLVLLTPRTSRSLAGKSLILLLTLGLIAAHYSVAYYFLALLLVSSVVSRFFRRCALPGISVGTLLIAMILTLAWYSSVAGGTGFTQLTQGMSLVIGNIRGDFFSGISRPGVVQEAVTFGGLPGWLHDANRVSQWAVQIFLVLGFLILLQKRGKSIVEYQFLPFTAAAMSFLIGALVLPFFAGLLNLSRIYHLALIFIAPCFCYGVDSIYSFGKQLKLVFSNVSHFRVTRIRVSKSFAAAVLICYFLFVSGWVWAVSMNQPTSLILDAQRAQSYSIASQQDYYLEFTVPSDASAARWIQDTSPTQAVCADMISSLHVLVSYGDRPPTGQDAPILINYGCPPESLIFLSEYDTANGIIVIPQYNESAGYWQTLPTPNLTAANRIYSDGAAIYST